MAHRPVEVTLGRAAALVVAAFVTVPVAAVALRAGGAAWPGPADWAALRFTLLQAALSAIFSALLAIPVARALHRRRFALRGAYVMLLGAPFILPVIVAVMGLVTVFGRGGVVNAGLGALGLPPVSIYGLHGIVLAHVFFNLPLAIRLLLQGWQSIPAERFRLAVQLGAGPREMRRLLEWPMLARHLPGVLAIVFAICLSSFAVALILGGGPRSTTVELGIYQAFRFEFDLARATVLALIQLALVAGAAMLAIRLSASEGFGRGLDRPMDILPGGGRAALWLDRAWLVLTGLFLLTPMTAIVLRGLGGLGDLPASVFVAAGVSIVIALTATVLTVGVTLAIALSRSRWASLAAFLPLAVSPLVLGTGLFLLINPVARPGDWALVVTLAVNVVAAAPFAMRILGPSAEGVEADYGRLADSLSMRGWARLRWLILPRMRRPLGFAAAITAALSMGDLGVIALFADPDRATLPLMVWRLMGAYQTEAAAGAALLLLALSLALFALFDAGGRYRADT
ncbi:MAG: thiamine/thiamine pyrophosphate ABC transporter permease ThiP [Pseudooceanicola sp.]